MDLSQFPIESDVTRQTSLFVASVAAFPGTCRAFGLLPNFTGAPPTCLYPMTHKRYETRSKVEESGTDDLVYSRTFRRSCQIIGGEQKGKRFYVCILIGHHHGSKVNHDRLFSLSIATCMYIFFISK